MNMKRQIAYIKMALLRFAPLALVLGFLSCGNIFDAPELPAPAAGRGTVRVWLGDSETGQRTLMPQGITAGSFAKYRLTVSGFGASDGDSYDLEPANFTSGYSLTLNSGSGTITVLAYLTDGDRNANKPAAKGRADLADETGTDVNIILKPVMDALDPDAVDGTFVYQITESGISGASGFISLSPYQGNGSHGSNVLNSFLVSYNADVKEFVPPGQYLMQLQLYPPAGLSGTVQKTEIVHIYSNLETRAEYTISAADFMAATAISGNIDFRENGVTQTNYSLYVYRDTDQPGYPPSLGTAYIFSETTYSLSIPQPDENITVRFYAYNHSRGKYYQLDSLAVAAGSTSLTKNLSHDVNFITLSGTLSDASGYTGEAAIYANSDPARSEEIGYYCIADLSSDNTWSLTMEAQDPPVPFYLAVVQYGGYGAARFIADPVYAGSAGQTNIALQVDFSKIAIYGKVNPKISGQTPLNPRVEVYSDWYHSNLLGSGNVDSQGNWSIQTNEASIYSSCYFKVFGTLGGVEHGEDSMNVNIGSSDVYIDLRTVDIIPKLQLSGTVNVTVNGFAPEDIYIEARDIGICYASGGSWAMDIPADYAGTVRFIVHAEVGREWYQKDTGVTRTVSGTNISGIALNITITTISLSGTVSVTVDGSVPDDITIEARDNENREVGGCSASGGSWTMNIPADYTGTVRFIVYAYAGGEWYNNIATGVTQTVSGASISGITLNVAATMITVSGTAKSNGSSIPEGMIMAYSFHQ
jgi:hypothetical protein